MKLTIAVESLNHLYYLSFSTSRTGPKLDTHILHILSWRLGREKTSKAVLPLPLIQEEQLSVTGKRMCTKYW